MALVASPVPVPVRGLEQPRRVVRDRARFDRDLPRVELVRVRRARGAHDEATPAAVVPPVQEGKGSRAAPTRARRVVGFPRGAERLHLQRRRDKLSPRCRDFVRRDPKVGSDVRRQDEPVRARGLERRRAARREARAPAGRTDTWRTHRSPDGAGVLVVGRADARIDELVLICRYTV